MSVCCMKTITLERRKISAKNYHFLGTSWELSGLFVEECFAVEEGGCADNVVATYFFIVSPRTNTFAVQGFNSKS